MDERQLAELFRDAVHDAPPAAFDERDVVTASRRVQARRYSAIAVGSALGVTLLAGAAVAGIDLADHSRPSTEAIASSHPGARPSSGSFETYDMPVPRNGGANPAQGGGIGGKGTPRDSGNHTGCGPVDRDLGAALAQELPAAANLQPVPVDGTCPAGARAAGYLVRDDDAVGMVSVILVRSSAGGSGANAQFVGEGESTMASVSTPHGDELIVVSESGQGSSAAPFGPDVAAIAQRLASRY